MTFGQRERAARQRIARQAAKGREWLATLSPEERERLEKQKQAGRERLLFPNATTAKVPALRRLFDIAQ